MNDKYRRFGSALAALVLAVAPAFAAPAFDAAASFADAAKGAKQHIASGFVCPERVGVYVRDAAGERDVASRTDFCSYYGFDGIYGTVVLAPATGAYDPQQSLAAQFAMEEGTGAKQIAQTTLTLGSKSAPLSVFSRTYETSHLETLHYRITYTGTVVKGWIVETTTEYAEPRDTPVQQAFLDWVYGDGLKTLTARAVAAQ